MRKITTFVRDENAPKGFRAARVGDVIQRTDKFGSPMQARRPLDFIELGPSVQGRLADGARDLLDAYHGASTASNPSEYAHHAKAFGLALGRHKRRLRDSQQTDSDLYSLLAQFEVMAQVIENIVVSPELVDLLPNKTIGTLSDTAIYKRRDSQVAIPRMSWEPTFGAGAGAHSETAHPVHFIPLSLTAELSRLERQREQEYNGRTSTPWDSFGAQIASKSHDIRSFCGLLSAHGDPSLQITGLVNNGEVTNIQQVDWFPAAGLAAYNAIAGEINAQWAQVNWAPEYMGDTLILPSQHFHELSSRLVSSTGDNDTTVISMLFANHPMLRVIAFARELAYDANLVTQLTPKIGEDRADDLGGGYRVGEDDHRPALIVTRSSSDVQEVLKGHDLMIEPLQRADNGDAAHLRESCGGIKVYRPEVPRISYLPEP